jgi:hypothetical protein
LETIYFTRCPVPTATGLAYRQQKDFLLLHSILDFDFDFDGWIDPRPLAENP